MRTVLVRKMVRYRYCFDILKTKLIFHFILSSSILFETKTKEKNNEKQVKIHGCWFVSKVMVCPIQKSCLFQLRLLPCWKSTYSGIVNRLLIHHSGFTMGDFFWWTVPRKSTSPEYPNIDKCWIATNTRPQRLSSPQATTIFCKSERRLWWGPGPGV